MGVSIIEAQPNEGNGAAGAPSALVRVLRADGSADPALDPGVGLARLVELYSAMRRARVIDERLAALGDAGRIGFVPSTRGREAAVVGATVALRDDDWIFPTGADWASALVRGVSLGAYLHRVHGNAQDPLLGHDMPAGLSAKGARIASASAPAATHLPHAVGLAWAAAQRGEDVVSAAFFDAREVDAADFHTGLNFAGVMKVPTLFVCRVPEGQPGAAEHAVAYGLEARRCDGSDLLAVLRVVRDAVEARRPVVIDLVLGDEDDALDRARAHLERRDAWDDAREAALSRATEETLSSAIDAASRAGAPPLESIFEGVFSTLPPHLARQSAEAKGAPRAPR